MVFSVPLGLNNSFGYVPMQGMRVHHDTTNGQLAVSAAACSAHTTTIGTCVFAPRRRRPHRERGGRSGTPGWRHWVTVRDDTLLLATLPRAISWAALAWSRSHWQAAEGARMDGELWDRTFVDRNPAYWNLEYGVDATHDGGCFVTCGNGETIPKGVHWDCHW